ILSRVLSAVSSANVSAQSPPCNRNASPRPAAARWSRNRSASPAKTSGGTSASRRVESSSSSLSGHWGCCLASRVRQWSRPVTSVGSGRTLTRSGQAPTGVPSTAVRASDAGRERPEQRSALGRLHLLADPAQHAGEPFLPDVEGLATGDAGEGDGGQFVTVLLVVADHPGAPVHRGVHRQVGHRTDQGEVLLVRRRGAGEVAALLHHGLLRAD